MNDENRSGGLAAGPYSEVLELARECSRLQRASVWPELSRLLVRLDDSYRRLMALNEQLRTVFCAWSSQVDENDVLTIKFGEETCFRLQLTRKDPNVPPQRLQHGSFAAYTAGKPHDVETEETAKAKLELETLLESYYYTAFRVLSLFQAIRGKRVDCRPIIDVRNNLVEHPKDWPRKYTFGFGTAGPEIQAMRAVESKFRDRGLVANTADFVSALRKAIVELGS